MQVPRSKAMLRTIVLFISLGIASLASAQKPEAGKLVQIYGTVSDSISGELLQATVDVLVPDNERPIAFTDTNTDGNYGLLLNEAGVYVLQVELEGYRNFIRQLDLTDDQRKKVELQILMQKEH